MANQVKVNIKASVEVKNTDFEVVVKKDDTKLGKLLISKGNIKIIKTPIVNMVK
jgi:hypothetical protein